MRTNIFSFILLCSGALFTSSNFIAHTPSGNSSEELLENYLYQSYLHLESNDFDKPPFDLYERGMIGYLQLTGEEVINENSNLITLIDFRVSSNNKRLWIIDTSTGTILHHTLVAHGKNTGWEYAKTFSNKIYSNSSSLGFYKISETYHGKHGLSIRLDGLEKGFNDNARTRAVVMHSANYVSSEFIEKYGRLGRSFGCPAIPLENHEEIISLLSNKGILFIYHPTNEYEKNTTLNDPEKALEYLLTAKELS